MRAHSSDRSAPAPDALSEMLQDLRLSNGTYGRCELTRPWGIDFPVQPEARFHFVVSGASWLRAPKRGWIELRAGDVALLPKGAAHQLADRARGRVRPLEEMPLEDIGDRAYSMRAGGSGARTVLVCCSVGFQAPAMHPILELMPALVLMRGGGTRDPALPALLDAMAEEVTSKRMGMATIMTRLADVLVARTIRAWVESRNDDTSGWIAAIRDPRIGRAIAAIHREPGRPWTLESLAEVARMSRSVFAERFPSLVGAPPAKYLARVRMHVASGWLYDEQATVGEVAGRLGYESEAAFSRAFKRFVGMAPGAMRRAGR